MKPVLILTKNILHEIPFQQQIQSLDLEVLTSSELLNELIRYQNDPELLNYFSIIIFSETVSEDDLQNIVPIVKKDGLSVIRMVERVPIKEGTKQWELLGIDRWLSKLCSLEELRETVKNLQNEQIAVHSGGNLPIDSKNIPAEYFSKNERLVIKLLCDSPDEPVSRKELCEKIWGEDNVSTKSQLSALVARIKQKLLNIGFRGETIQTLWGKGYKFSSNYFDQFDRNEDIQTFFE